MWLTFMRQVGINVRQGSRIPACYRNAPAGLFFPYTICNKGFQWVQMVEFAGFIDRARGTRV